MKKNLTERMMIVNRSGSGCGPAAPSGADFQNGGKKGGVA